MVTNGIGILNLWKIQFNLLHKKIQPQPLSPPANKNHSHVTVLSFEINVLILIIVIQFNAA